MNQPRPWEGGDHDSRWNGYLIEPDSNVLRNRLGATTAEGLRSAENDLLEFRVAELRSRPSLIARTYDLSHLKALHFHLFQDVYEWAGDLRTVGIAKGEGEDNSFIPPLEINRPVAHVASRISESNRLNTVPADGLVDEVTYLYDYINLLTPSARATAEHSASFSPSYSQSPVTDSPGTVSTWTPSTWPATSPGPTATPPSSERLSPSYSPTNPCTEPRERRPPLQWWPQCPRHCRIEMPSAAQPTVAIPAPTSLRRSTPPSSLPEPRGTLVVQVLPRPSTWFRP